jgi:hypothetical protein
MEGVSKMKPLIAQRLDGKNLRGEAVKPWKFAAETGCYRSLERLYAEIREAFGAR